MLIAATARLPGDQRARRSGGGSRRAALAGDRPDAGPGRAGRRLPLCPGAGDPGGRPGRDGPAGPPRRAGQGGAAIEGLARVDTFAFDKTGTLTEGKPELGDCIAFGPTAMTPSRPPPDELLRLAAAAEQPSEHPLARLLVAEAETPRARPCPTVDDFQAQPGAGVLATLAAGGTPNRRPILVGNLRLVREHGVDRARRGRAGARGPGRVGQTALIVVCDGQVAGRDRCPRSRPARGARRDPRPEAPGPQGPDDPDRRPRRAGAAVAKKVHIKQVEAELTPAGKAEWVERRRARRPDRGHGRRRHQRRPGPGPGRRRAGAGGRRRRPRRRGRLGRPDGRPARARCPRRSAWPGRRSASSARTSSSSPSG